MTKELLKKAASIIDATVSWCNSKLAPEDIVSTIIKRWNVPTNSLTEDELITILVMLGNMELPFCMPTLLTDGSVELIDGQKQQKYQMGYFSTTIFYEAVDEEKVREYFNKATTMIDKFNQCNLYKIDSDFVIHLTAILQEDERREKFIQFIGDYSETSIEDKWKLIGDAQFVVWADDTKDSVHPGIAYGRVDDDYGCHKIAGGHNDYARAYEQLVNNFVGYENGYTIKDCGIYHIPTCKTCPYFYLENDIDSEKSKYCNKCKIVEEAIKEVLNQEPKIKCYNNKASYQMIRLHLDGYRTRKQAIQAYNNIESYITIESGEASRIEFKPGSDEAYKTVNSIEEGIASIKQQLLKEIQNEPIPKRMGHKKRKNGKLIKLSKRNEMTRQTKRHYFANGETVVLSHESEEITCDKVAIHAWSADDHFDDQYYLFDEYGQAKEACDKLNHDEQEAHGHDYYCVYYDLEPWWFDKKEEQ